MEPKECLEAIINKRGTQFDPRIVDAMLRVLPEFKQIWDRFSD